MAKQRPSSAKQPLEQPPKTGGHTRLSSYLAHELDRQKPSWEQRLSSFLKYAAIWLLALAQLGILAALVWLVFTVSRYDNMPAVPEISVALAQAGQIIPREGQMLSFNVLLDGANAEELVAHFEATGGEAQPPLSLVRGGSVSTRFVPHPDADAALIVVRVQGTERAFPLSLAARPAPPAAVSLQVNREQLLANGRDSVPVVVSVADAQNSPLPGIAVRLRVEPEGGGQFDSSSAQTGPNGSVQVTYVAGTQTGAVTLIAEWERDPKVSGSGHVELIAPQPGLTVTPSGTVFWNSGDEEAVLNVTLLDALGNPLAGIPVRFELLPSNAAAEARFLGVDAQPLEGQTVIERTTDEQGKTDARLRLGAVPGEVTVKVSAVVDGQETAQEVILTVQRPEPTTLVIIELPDDKKTLPADGSMQSSAPIVVTVADQQGAPMAGITVTFEMTPAEMGDMETEAMTDERGSAKVIFTAPRQVGEVTITARVGELEDSVTLTLTEVQAQPAPTPMPVDTDGDGRTDARERELGTDPNVPDDKVKTAGSLERPDEGIVLLTNVPVGVVLNRISTGITYTAQWQPVEIQVWVPVAQIKENPGNEGQWLLVVAQDTLVTLGDDNPVAPTKTQPMLTIEANDHVVTFVRQKDDFVLVNVWGLIKIENLDRP